MKGPRLIRNSVRLRDVILKPHSHGEAIAISAALVGSAVALRWIIDRGSLGVPFTTLYPATMIAALLLNWRYAVGVTVVSALIINELYLGQRWLTTFEPARIALFGLLALSSGLLIVTGSTVRKLLIDIEDLLEQQSHFNRELHHRIKNSLAIVQAMASQGARNSDPADFYKALTGRIGALAKANDLLTLDGRQETRCLRTLTQEAIAPFNQAGKFRVAGPDCIVPEISCIPLVMALHELSTNAVKHGALSQDAGTVDITWDLQTNGTRHKVNLHWQEKGGPEVLPPTRKGLGSRLLSAQKGIAAVDLQFLRDGVHCDMTLEDVTTPTYQTVA